MRIHCHDGAVDFRHLAQSIIAGLVDRLDIDHVADLHDILRSVRRRADRRALLDFRTRPGEFAERNGSARSIFQADLDRFGVAISQNDGDAPGVDARLIARAFERALPVAIDVDVADRAAPAVAAVVAYQAGAQRVHRVVLQARVESRAHLQATVIERLHSVFGIENAPHFLDEIIRVFRLNAHGTHLRVERLFQRGISLRAADIAVLVHLPDHPVAAVERGLFVIARIVIAGRLG